MILIGLLIVLMLSFYLMGKICDEYFVESLDQIAKQLRMSHEAAGATLMAVGSSAPELFIAIIALTRSGQEGDIGLGTIVGSAVFNILIITGFAIIVRKAVLTWQPVVRDLLFYSMSVLLLIFALYDGEISVIEGVILVGLYLIYVIAVINWRKIFPYKDNGEKESISEENDKDDEKPKGILQKILMPLDFVLSKFFPPAKYKYAVFTISITLIAALSWVMVESAVEVAHILNIPPAIIGLTILAAGTSVADLISSMIVAKQGRAGMAFSNAVGSNVFDILIGLGLPWLIVLIIKNEAITVETESLFTSSVILLGSVIVVLLTLLIQRWKIGKATGIFFISLYVIYLCWEILKLYI